MTLTKTLTIILTATMMMQALTSCGNGNSGQAEMSPEKVVEAFHRAVASGDMATALSMCDSTSMGTYISSHMKIREKLSEEDSTSLSIASGILADSPVEISRTGKQGQDRYIYYRIAAGNRNKEKKATLRKEEGEWKVTSITDAD